VRNMLQGKLRVTTVGLPSERFVKTFARGRSKASNSKLGSIVSKATGERDRTSSVFVEDLWLGVGLSVRNFCKECAIES
jgi:hypothetical protein